MAITLFFVFAGSPLFFCTQVCWSSVDTTSFLRKNSTPGLISFFRNLMMGEQSELKNRFMIVNPPEEWIEELNPTSTRQVPDKFNGCSKLDSNLSRAAIINQGNAFGNGIKRP